MNTIKAGDDLQHLDAKYQNGQSDAEKLMRRHLQEPGHILTDEDLRNLNVRDNEAPAVSLSNSTRDLLQDTDEDARGAGPDAILTPLNVLGG